MSKLYQTIMKPSEAIWMWNGSNSGILLLLGIRRQAKDAGNACTFEQL